MIDCVFYNVYVCAYCTSFVSCSTCCVFSGVLRYPFSERLLYRAEKRMLLFYPVFEQRLLRVQSGEFFILH